MLTPAAASHVFAFLTVLLWSSAYVYTKVALAWFSPTALGLLRCLTASAVLLAVILAKRLSAVASASRASGVISRVRASGVIQDKRAGGVISGDHASADGPEPRIGPPRPADIPKFLFSGAAGFALYLLVFNKGTESLNPTTSCIIISASPIITALIARAAFKERLAPGGWAAICAAFCGILIMTLWDGSIRISWGIAWMTAAAVLISIYNIMQRALARDYSALQITAYSFTAASLMLLVFLPETAEQAAAAPAYGLAVAFFLGVFPSALAYLAWARALALASKVSTVANYMFLTPFLALLLEYAVFGEFPGPGTFWGGAVILSSLALFTRTGRK